MKNIHKRHIKLLKLNMCPKKAIQSVTNYLKKEQKVLQRNIRLFFCYIRTNFVEYLEKKLEYLDQKNHN